MHIFTTDAIVARRGILPMNDRAWNEISSRVLARPAHAPVWVHRTEVPHPSLSGFYRSHGLDRHAKAHYRHPLPDQRCLHVLEYPNYYCLHWDHIDPAVSLWGHFVRDVVTTLLHSHERGLSPEGRGIR